MSENKTSKRIENSDTDVEVHENKSDMELGFHFRINEIVQASGKDPFAWAKSVGIPSATFNRIWNKQAVPRAEHLLKISEYCEVSLDWLLTGKENSEKQTNAVVGADTLNGDYIGIPRYDAHLSAGGGVWNTQIEKPLDHIPFTREFLAKRLHKSKPSDLVILMVNGDSMEPLINDDDIVMVDQSKKRLEDGIFAFVFDDLAKVKRFRTLANGDLEIISENSIYRPEILKREQLNDLNIIGKVVWCGHHFAR